MESTEVTLNSAIRNHPRPRDQGTIRASTPSQTVRTHNSACTVALALPSDGTRVFWGKTQGIGGESIIRTCRAKRIAWNACAAPRVSGSSGTSTGSGACSPLQHTSPESIGQQPQARSDLEAHVGPEPGPLKPIIPAHSKSASSRCLKLADQRLTEVNVNRHSTFVTCSLFNASASAGLPQPRCFVLQRVSLRGKVDP
jgi:hypothetical protein